MKKIIITAESGSDLTRDEAQRYGIRIVPMHVTFDDTCCDDGSFPVEKIMQYYEKTGRIPKTSGCSPEEFIRVFDEIHRKYPQAHILHLAYSAVTTVSYASARLAASGRDYVTVLDTKHVSAGQRAVILQTFDLLADYTEISEEELIRSVTSICENTKMCFMPSTLDYLRAGGRCSGLSYLGGKVMKILPCIEIVNGKLIPVKKYRGTMEKTVPSMICDYTDKWNFDKKHLWLLYSSGLPNTVRRRAEEAVYACGFRKLEWVETGGVITTHAGPGAFGIVGVEEEKNF